MAENTDRDEQDEENEEDRDSDSLDFLRMAARTEPVTATPPKPTTNAAADDALIGATLGRYRLNSLLGRGGMGVVYRATDTTLRREVAIKVLPHEMVADVKRRKRFLREARLAAVVTHANIATIFDVGEDDGRVYIAMELVQGETLDARARLTKHGVLEPTEVARIGLEVARALARAHEAHIVHRDIKPDNIMMTSDGAVKVLDFGLAKSWKRSSDEEPPKSGIATEPGAVLGTPPYMSPEQAKGQVVDGRSDVFSFGVMLYELLAGRRPFEGRHLADVLVAHRKTTPTPVARACKSQQQPQQPSPPRQLATLVDSCIRTDANARPTMATILTELGAVALAQSPTPWRRYSTAIMAFIAIITLLLFLLLLVTR